MPLVAGMCGERVSRRGGFVERTFCGTSPSVVRWNSSNFGGFMGRCGGTRSRGTEGGRHPRDPWGNFALEFRRIVSEWRQHIDFLGRTDAAQEQEDWRGGRPRSRRYMIVRVVDMHGIEGTVMSDYQQDLQYVRRGTGYYEERVRGARCAA